MLLIRSILPSAEAKDDFSGSRGEFESMPVAVCAPQWTVTAVWKSVYSVEYRIKPQPRHQTSTLSLIPLVLSNLLTPWSLLSKVWSGEKMIVGFLKYQGVRDLFLLVPFEEQSKPWLTCAHSS